MNRDTPMPLIVAAAVMAVGFWSLKPVFITLVGDRAGPGEVFVAAGVMSVLASLLGALVMGRSTSALIGAAGTGRGLLLSAVAGLFLGMWYYGFYRALYGAPKVDATVIAFTWPLFAILAMRIFAPEYGRRLRPSEYALVLVAFLGAASIGVSNLGPGATGGGDRGEILFAFLAAMGSGFYLPFAVKAIACFGDVVGSRIRGTFYTISIANVVSLAVVLAAMQVFDQPLRFYAFDTQVLIICGMIGIGTYLVAEITWTWAFAEYQSMTLSTLPYFSPAVSVVLLYLLFGEPVTAIAALGLVLVLFSNLTLHGRFLSNSAPVMALVGTVYVALASQLVRPLDSPGVLVETMHAIAALFAIQAGFILARVAGRRSEELDARSALVRAVLTLRDGSGVGDTRVEALLRQLVDTEFAEGAQDKPALAAGMRHQLGEMPGDRDDQRAALAAFDRWFTINRDRLSVGEKAALWITGLGAILFLMLIRADTAYGLIGLYVFAAGCLLVIFTINDYQQNNFNGFGNQLLRLQQGFAELGRCFYMPAPLARNREFANLPQGTPITYRDDDGTLVETVLQRRRSRFPAIYWSTGALVIAALIYLPLSTQQQQSAPLSNLLRPQVSTSESSAVLIAPQADVTVARFDWAASRVAAQVVALVIEQRLDLTAVLRDSTVGDVFAQMDAGQIDVHPDLWTDNQPQNMARYVETAAPVATLNARGYAGVQGVYMPRATAGRLGVDALAALTRPEVARAFDTDGDGLGEIWLGARGWESTALMQQMLSETGLDRLWEGEVYSERVFRAKLDRFMAQDRPLVFYSYEPNDLHTVHDLVEITGLDTARPDAAAACPPDLPGPLCALRSTRVHVAYAQALQTDRPRLAALLRDVVFTRKDVSGWLARTTRRDVPPGQVAADWVAANADRIAAWGSGP